jgi:threonine dehydrogenase-like Zn-dependent dehydrogenase
MPMTFTSTLDMQLLAGDASQEERPEREVDPSLVMSHRVNLQEVPKTYKLWNKKEDGVVKVAWTP